jgi:glycerate kinase
MTATKVCEIVKTVINEVDETAVVDLFPMADGGEGTVEAVVYNKKGAFQTCRVEGPLGQEVTATYGITGDGTTAIMEMAESSGITLISRDERDPMEASTVGVGQMIKDALDKGCARLLLGIGGSATNDGGTGMLTALGYKFLDQEGRPLKGCGKNLKDIVSIDNSGADPRLENLQILVACDVDNPLTGQKGATHIYGPQKGATPEMLKVLESGMKNYATRVMEYNGLDVDPIQGAGAAGGLGAGLVAFLGATLESGFKMVSEAVQLEKQIEEGCYDLIITGEGQINHQTLHGKLPQGVSLLGAKYKTPVVGIVGSIGEGYEPILESGMIGLFSILNRPMSLEQAMKESETLLSDTIRRVYSLFSGLQ